MYFTEIKHVSAVLKILSMEKNTVQITHNSKIQSNCRILLMGVLGSLSFVSTAFAATSYEIQSGDSLSKIIANNYPDVKRRSYSIIVQNIIANNPAAFSNNNANSLRLGKTLNLLDRDKIEGLKKKTPPIVEEKPKSNDQETTIPDTTAALDKEKVAPADQDQADVDIQSSTESPPANAALEQKVEDLNAEIEQLRTLVTKYEAEQESADTDSTAKPSDNSASEDLLAENEQLRALVTKYEAEQNAEPNDTKEITDTTTDQTSDDLRTEMEQLKALVQKYEAEAEDSSAQIPVTNEGNESAVALKTLNAKLDTLTQQNKQLQTALSQAKSQLSTANQTASTAAKDSSVAKQTISAQQSATPSIWQQFSWILPLLAILIGLYLLMRLIKRIRDKKATKELKIALSSSPATEKTNTASAFSIDGTMLPTASTVDDAPVEEDSVEAGIKIDMAKAYLDLDDGEAAQELLQEAIIEGSAAQRAIAENLLKKL
jgi:FimV-like protein